MNDTFNRIPATREDNKQTRLHFPHPISNRPTKQLTSEEIENYNSWNDSRPMFNPKTKGRR